MKKIIKWIKKLFWWRFHYIKTRITTEEANRGRCIICHAGIRVNPNDKSQPICQDYNCPCKLNERLIIKSDRQKDELLFIIISVVILLLMFIPLFWH